MSNCPVCESTNIKTHPNNLSECPDCNHIFQTDLAVTIEYDANYMKNYDTYPTETMAHLRTGFVIAHLESDASASKPKILDVGYGNGSFLKTIEKYGTEVYGLDVHGVDYGIKEVDLNSKLDFKVITFFDSLEHFENFDQVLGLSAEIVVVSLPYYPEWFLQDPKNWRHFKPGEHLHYFSKKSLNHLFKSKGYELVMDCFLEDVLRGKLDYNGKKYHNILTAVYRKK
jgi:hypothetical protein